MKSNRRTAILVGVFYIIGTVSGVLSMVNLGSFLEDPDYLANIATDETKIILGALYILIMGLALAMVPVLLYPLFKKYNRALALGAVVFRGTLETVVYMVSSITGQELGQLYCELRSTSPGYIEGCSFIDPTDQAEPLLLFYSKGPSTLSIEYGRPLPAIGTPPSGEAIRLD